MKVASICLLLWYSAAPAWSQVPQYFSHHGRLLENGQANNATTQLEFRLYDGRSSTMALWIESHQLELVNGYYSVLLGTTTPLLAEDLANSQQIHLGIAVNGGPELSPRLPLTTVPFALLAEHAILAEDIECRGCISSREVDFNYAASRAAGGAALNLECSDNEGCVGNTELEDGSVTPVKLAPCQAGDYFRHGASGWDCSRRIQVGYQNACESQDAGTLRYDPQNKDMQYCDGSTWIHMGIRPGTYPIMPGRSCSDILDGGYSLGDGVYWVDPNGGVSADAFQIYCDMTGGGWMQLRTENKSYSWRNNNCGGIPDADCVPDSQSGYTPHVLFAEGEVGRVHYLDYNDNRISDDQLKALANLNHEATANVKVWSFDVEQSTVYNGGWNYHNGSHVNSPPTESCLDASPPDNTWVDISANFTPYIANRHIFLSFDPTSSANWGVWIHFIEGELRVR